MDLWRLSGSIPSSKQEQLQNCTSVQLNSDCLKDIPAGTEMPHIPLVNLLECLTSFMVNIFFPLYKSQHLVAYTWISCAFFLLLCTPKSSLSLTSPVQAVEDCNEISPDSSHEPFFPGWTNQLSSVSSQASCAPVSKLLDGPPLNYLQYSHLSLVLGSPDLDPALQMHIISPDQRQSIPYLNWQALVSPMQPDMQLTFSHIAGLWSTGCPPGFTGPFLTSCLAWACTGAYGYSSSGAGFCISLCWSLWGFCQPIYPAWWIKIPMSCSSAIYLPTVPFIWILFVN